MEQLQPDYVSLKEAAAVLKMAPRDLTRALRRDGVGLYYFTRRYVAVKKEELQAWVERKRVESAATAKQPTKRLPPSARREKP